MNTMTRIGRFRPLSFRRAGGLALLLAALSAPAVQAADVNGRLHWADVIRVSVPVSGVVDKVPVQPGAQVDKGALLVRIDRRPFDDRLKAAVANREGLVRAATEAARDADRVQALYDRTVASDSERQQALIKKEQASAKLKDAKAMVSLRRWQRGHTEVTAPFPARILSVDVAPGETVSSQLQPPVLLRIARSDKFDARIVVTAEQAANLKLGQRLGMTVSGTQVDGKIVAIAARKSATANYRVSIRVPARSDWLAGLPVKVALP